MEAWATQTTFAKKKKKEKRKEKKIQNGIAESIKQNDF